MTFEEVEIVVRVTLELAKDHWRRTGMPIKPEDTRLVMEDAYPMVLARLPKPE